MQCAFQMHHRNCNTKTEMFIDFSVMVKSEIFFCSFFWGIVKNTSSFKIFVAHCPNATHFMHSIWFIRFSLHIFLVFFFITFGLFVSFVSGNTKCKWLYKNILFKYFAWKWWWLNGKRRNIHHDQCVFSFVAVPRYQNYSNHRVPQYTFRSPILLFKNYSI